ncbi:hypothetical protein JX265_012499 [Neoarthrinium moseri]|uniref:Uncharacterized protein n=1 Tax=Neoarthrinium moseri TaxID=1658444 RepID=A0A9P9WAK7_9PEZI|nr:uncharacterized protein JN550_003184 [Neoarthrinium moseri]KAI1854330.1 hypothetical protein JX265_012499 [Neoarthrinium moseri]KAI1873915.1 hypothetical protein JN550_003184 [Neoarthrinium moseri]
MIQLGDLVAEFEPVPRFDWLRLYSTCVGAVTSFSLSSSMAVPCRQRVAAVGSPAAQPRRLLAARCAPGPSGPRRRLQQCSSACARTTPEARARPETPQFLFLINREDLQAQGATLKRWLSLRPLPFAVALHQILGPSSSRKHSNSWSQSEGSFSLISTSSSTKVRAAVCDFPHCIHTASASPRPWNPSYISTFYTNEQPPVAVRRLDVSSLVIEYTLTDLEPPSSPVEAHRDTSFVSFRLSIAIPTAQSHYSSLINTVA